MSTSDAERVPETVTPLDAEQEATADVAVEQEATVHQHTETDAKFDSAPDTAGEPEMLYEPRTGRAYAVKTDVTVNNAERTDAQLRDGPTHYDPHRAAERYWRRTRNCPTTAGQ